MKKLLPLFFTVLILSSAGLSGQSREIGLRAGYRSGIFYQVTSQAGNAGLGYHALLSFNNNGLQLTGLRIIYATELSEITPDLYLAWGYGGHAGFVNIYRERNPLPNLPPGGKETSLTGIRTGTVGTVSPLGEIRKGVIL